MTLETRIVDVEDFSIGTRQVLERNGLVTLGDVLRWKPDGSIHLFALDNITAILEDLGYDWPI